MVDRAAVYVKEILRVCPEGPVLLTGWCAAASLTVEIARQLHALDHPGRSGSSLRRRASRLSSCDPRLLVLQAHCQPQVSLPPAPRRIQTKEADLFCTPFCVAFGTAWWSRSSCTIAHWYYACSGSLDFPCPTPFSTIRGPVWPQYKTMRRPDIPEKSGCSALWMSRGFRRAIETLGWKEIVDGGVEVVFVEGDHESMFHDPNVDLLSLRLRQALQPGA